ncbi:MAG TPA: hypothetical protein H9699_06615 [Candidatus Gemmiger stercoravium]|nr:hypothetical protein [Candidatus Gemmiger stercoravium]
MKLKKLVSAVVCAAMACVFAVSAFAATDSQVQEAQNYLNANGINYTISDVEVDRILDEFGTQAAAEAAANGIIADVKANPNNATNIVKDALARYGVTVENLSVTVNADGSVSGSGTINGKAVSASFTVPADAHGDIAANKDENGNWHVDEATTAAASSVTTTAGGVIKATGDNSAVVLVAGVLVVAAVLGLAVRKNSNVG